MIEVMSWRFYFIKRGPKKVTANVTKKSVFISLQLTLDVTSTLLAEEARTSQFKQPRINFNINFRLSSPPYD